MSDNSWIVAVVLVGTPAFLILSAVFVQSTIALYYYLIRTRLINIIRYCNGKVTPKLIDKVKFCLEERIEEIDTRDETGLSAIHYSSRINSTDLVQVLIEYGAHIDILVRDKDDWRGTALFSAIDKYDDDGEIEEMICLFIDCGMNTLLSNDEGTTLLHWACEVGKVCLATQLLRVVDVDILDHASLTPLHYASQKGGICKVGDIKEVHRGAEVAAILLSKGADINAKTVNYDTPLHAACKSDMEEMVYFLLQRAANTEVIDDLKMTPLLTMVKKNTNNEIVLALVYGGASICARCSNDMTPLLYAVDYLCNVIVMTLIEEGAELEILYRGDNQTVLHRSIVKEGGAIAMALIDKGANLRARSGIGWTPLHYAVDTTSISYVAIALIAKGAELEVPYPSGGQTVLHYSLVKGENAVAITLINKGANVNALCQKGFTPLMYAIDYMREYIAIVLVDKGVDLEVTFGSTGQTPLHRAIIKNECATAVALVDKGANILARCLSRWSPLQYAIDLDRSYVATLLMDKGVDVEDVYPESGQSLLHRSMEKGEGATSMALIVKGANIRAVCGNKWQPLHYAVNSGRSYVAITLIAMGVDMEAKYPGNGRTVLHHAIEKCDDAVAMALIDKGANLRSQAGNGWTPLHFAVNSSRSYVANALINKDVPVNLTFTSDGKSLLHRAVELGNGAVVDVLLSKGATVEAKCNKGWTPLQYAVHYDHIYAIRSLAKYGANVEVTYADGCTPLLLAVKARNGSVAAELLRCNANVDAIDSNRWTALAHAVDSQSTALIILLLEHGANVEIGNPLHNAAKSKYLEGIALLVQKDANTFAAYREFGETQVEERYQDDNGNQRVRTVTVKTVVGNYLRNTDNIATVRYNILFNFSVSHFTIDLNSHSIIFVLL